MAPGYDHLIGESVYLSPGSNYTVCSSKVTPKGLRIPRISCLFTVKDSFHLDKFHSVWTIFIPFGLISKLSPNSAGLDGFPSLHATRAFHCSYSCSRFVKHDSVDNPMGVLDQDVLYWAGSPVWALMLFRWTCIVVCTCYMCIYTNMFSEKVLVLRPTISECLPQNLPGPHQICHNGAESGIYDGDWSVQAFSGDFCA